jgi:hypothetical protein
MFPIMSLPFFPLCFSREAGANSSRGRRCVALPICCINAGVARGYLLPRRARRRQQVEANTLPKIVPAAGSTDLNTEDYVVSIKEMLGVFDGIMKGHGAAECEDKRVVAEQEA